MALTQTRETLNLPRVLLSWVPSLTLKVVRRLRLRKAELGRVSRSTDASLGTKAEAPTPACSRFPRADADAGQREAERSGWCKGSAAWPGVGWTPWTPGRRTCGSQGVFGMRQGRRHSDDADTALPQAPHVTAGFPGKDERWEGRRGDRAWEGQTHRRATRTGCWGRPPSPVGPPALGLTRGHGAHACFV